MIVVTYFQDFWSQAPKQRSETHFPRASDVRYVALLGTRVRPPANMARRSTSGATVRLSPRSHRRTSIFWALTLGSRKKSLASCSGGSAPCRIPACGTDLLLRRSHRTVRLRTFRLPLHT
jgi:hypothetical protein